MRTAEGPFPMETTYCWDDAPGGATRMALRNRGEPAGFAKVTAPMMARAMRAANRKDLRRLKEHVEGRTDDCSDGPGQHAALAAILAIDHAQREPR